MKRLRLDLLGGFAAAIDGVAGFAIASRKGRALLAWLALQRGGQAVRESAMGLLWGDSPQKQAAASLNQTIYELRRALGDSGRRLLQSNGETLALCLETTTVDAVEYEQLAGSHDMGDLETAAVLYQGDLLAGFAAPTPEYEDWLEGERRRLRAKAIIVLSRLVTRYTEEGVPAPIADLAARLVDLDPYSEVGHCALMRHHAKAGQLGIANDIYETLRHRLHEDLGTTPSEEMERLRARILERHIGPNGARGSSIGSAVPEEAEISQRPQRAAGRSALMRYAGIFLAFALLLTGTAWWFSAGHDSKGDAPLDAAQGLPAKPSIAVLAFDDLSSGSDRGFLSDAISEGIITELSKFSGLFVIARNSSFRYRDRPTDPRQISRELGVRYVLEGSQQKAGGRLRVTIQLIDALSGDHIWSTSYDRDLADIFRVQDEIANTVASTLGEKLRKVAGEEVKRADPATLRAYELVLKGIRHFRDFTPEGTEQARLAYLAALDADPNLMQAHASLVWVYVNGYRWGWLDLDRSTALQRALGHAEMALDLAPDDYLPHMALGYALMQAGEMDRAIAELEKALQANPNAGNAMANLSEALGYVGRGEEAAALLERAMRLDPYHPDYFYWSLAWIKWTQGDCDQGLAILRQMTVMPNLARRTLASLYVCLGRVAEAEAAIAALLAETPDYALRDVRETFRNKIQDTALLNHWLDDLRTAGLPE